MAKKLTMKKGDTVYFAKADAKHRKYGVIAGPSQLPDCDWVVTFETGHTREVKESMLKLHEPAPEKMERTKPK